MAETSEQKSARMKAMWAAKKAAQNKNTPLETKTQPEPTVEEQHDPTFGPQPGQTEQPPAEPSVAELIARIQELEARKADEPSWRDVMGMLMQNQPQSQSQGPQFGSNGAVIGTREKYILDKSNYPNPSERLSDEKLLQRFAFKDNYELDWGVSVSQYQMKDGVNVREPKFTLKLNRIVYNDDTGERTNERYTICQAIFHEDPDAALAIAHEQGVDTSIYDEKHFLDEMRYLRMRDWLMEAFYPRRPQPHKQKREMVIGNRLVEVFEINSESNQTVPFNELSQNKKL